MDGKRSKTTDFELRAAWGGLRLSQSSLPVQCEVGEAKPRRRLLYLLAPRPGMHIVCCALHGHSYMRVLYMHRIVAYQAALSALPGLPWDAVRALRWLHACG